MGGQGGEGSCPKEEKRRGRGGKIWRRRWARSRGGGGLLLKHGEASGEPAAPSSKRKTFGANRGAEGEDEDEQGGRLQEEEGQGGEGSCPKEEKRRGRGGTRGN